MKAKISSSAVRRILLIVAAALLVINEGCRFFVESNEFTELIFPAITRFIGGAVCILFMLEFELGSVLNPLGNKKLTSVLLILPAFAVAVNNFPFVSFFAGDCGMSANASQIFCYALFCLSVGIFEEFAFRGCALMFLLKRFKRTRAGIFMAIFCSSVVFGLIHLVNVFESGIGYVVLQMGYSALIGALCSVVLLVTKNIWLCVLLHSLYNFAGGVIPKYLAYGEIWTGGEILLTAVVAVVVTVYIVVLFFNIPTESVDGFFAKTEAKEDEPQ